MPMRFLHHLLGTAALLAATPAWAQLRPLVDPPASAAAAARGVDIFLLNEGPVAVPAEGPGEIETVAQDGARLRLIAAPDEPAMVPPGGFARAHYRLAASASAVAVGAGAGERAPPVVPRSAPLETVSTTSAGSASGFFDRFRPREPIYGVFGLQDAGAKLQFSFGFRAAGRDDGPQLNLAYTQAMFWALNQPSGPFRATDYSPEVSVDLPIGRTTIIGAGYAHTSNGLGSAGSIDVNRLFLRATKSFTLGNGWEIGLTPQAWFYVGPQGTATNLDRYWGYTSLRATIGQQDGIKFSVTGRGNQDSGRGSAEMFVSYPLAEIFDAFPHIYIFGQAFTGYGEALTDYNKRDTHARLGIAFTR